MCRSFNVKGHVKKPKNLLGPRIGRIEIIQRFRMIRHGNVNAVFNGICETGRNRQENDDETKDGFSQNSPFLLHDITPSLAFGPVG